MGHDRREPEIAYRISPVQRLTDHARPLH